MSPTAPADSPARLTLLQTRLTLLTPLSRQPLLLGLRRVPHARSQLAQLGASKSSGVASSLPLRFCCDSIRCNLRRACEIVLKSFHGFSDQPFTTRCLQSASPFQLHRTTRKSRTGDSTQQDSPQPWRRYSPPEAHLPCDSELRPACLAAETRLHSASARFCSDIASARSQLGPFGRLPFGPDC